MENESQGAGRVMRAPLVDVDAQDQIREILTANMPVSRESYALCFDVPDEDRPPAWTAHEICARCQALLAFTESHMTDLINVFKGTKCLESSVPNTHPAGLPIEIVLTIIDVIVLEFVTSRDGTSIRKLLHTSCDIRATLIRRHFAAVEIVECCDRYLENRPLQRGTCDDFHVHLPRAIGTYIADSVAYRTLDFSLRRDASKPQHPANIGQLVTTFGLPMTTAGAWMTVRSDVRGCNDRANPEVYNNIYCSQFSDYCAVKASGSGVFRMLEDAMHTNGFELRASCWNPSRLDRNLDEVLRNINPYQRALDGTLSSTQRGVAISVQLRLRNYPADTEHVYDRSWFFDTLRVRKETMVPKLSPSLSLWDIREAAGLDIVDESDEEHSDEDSFEDGFEDSDEDEEDDEQDDE